MATSRRGNVEALMDYWASGAGLLRWSTSATPYRTLVRELRSEGVPAEKVEGLAANLYRRVFKRWPGRRGSSATRLAAQAR